MSQPILDRDQLREAIRTWESWEKLTRERNPEAYDRIAAMPGSSQPVYGLLVEAARLVADPNTLIISKVDGEWPAFVHDFLPGPDWQNSEALDALLEVQPK